MSKNHNKYNIPDSTTQTPQSTIVDTVTSRICTFTENAKQDEVINEMAIAGYEHYESIPIGGNEIILRFRKVK